MQRDLDSVRSEVAAVSKTTEGERAFLEERMRKLERDLQTSLEKARQERAEDIQGFMRSQSSLSTKLDELAEEARSSRGRVEEIGHQLSEQSKRIEGVGSQLAQLSRRVDAFEKQLAQAAGAAQEAKVTSQTAAAAAQAATVLAQQAATGSQDTAQRVTTALQDMAQQTNTAFEQMNATTQLALLEARRALSTHQGTQQPPAQPTIQPPGQHPQAYVTVPALAPAPPPAAAAPSKPAPVPPPKTEVSTLPPAELYRNALKDYTRGNYDQAINGFRAYIARYPRTPLMANARYWLSESLYSQKRYEQAIKEFELFVTEYPDSPKVAGALLKQGYAHIELGNAAQGRAVLTELLKRFPKSPEARLAKARLSHLKGGLGGRSAAQAPSIPPS